MDRALTGTVPHLRYAAARDTARLVRLNTKVAMKTTQQKNIQRTLIILSIVALAFYLSFIMLGVVRA